MVFHSVILLFLGPQLLLSNAAKFPTFIKKCSWSDPNLSECVLNQASSVRDAIINGYPELKIPKLSPFHINEITVQTSDRLKLQLKNTDVYGLEALKFEDIKLDKTTVPIKLGGHIVIPEANVYGVYGIDAKLLVMNIKGHGPLNATWYNLKVSLESLIETVMDETNSEHFKIKSLEVDYEYEKGKFYLGNLFNGNEELSNQTNKFLNENYRDLTKDFRPLLTGIIKTFILEITGNLMTAFTTKELFLP